MNNANQPAFPNLDPHIDVPDTGLTKREYFAAMAMQGIMSKDYVKLSITETKTDFTNVKVVAEMSIAIADELLKQLSLP